MRGIKIKGGDELSEDLQMEWKIILLTSVDLLGTDIKMNRKFFRGEVKRGRRSVLRYNSYFHGFEYFPFRSPCKSLRFINYLSQFFFVLT